MKMCVKKGILGREVGSKKLMPTSRENGTNIVFLVLRF